MTLALQILFLTQIIPYPPHAGPKVKTWHVLRYLAELGHRITLASFVRPEEEIHVQTMQQLCDAVYTVPIRRSRSTDLRYWLRSNFTRRPFLIERDDLRSMRELVHHLLSTKKIDAIHADQLTMTQFALPGSNGGFLTERSPVLIFDAHNAVWTIVERMLQTAPWYLQGPLSLEARRIKYYEGLIVCKFDRTLAVTEIDRQSLHEAVVYSCNGTRPHLPHIPVIPIAVDTRQLQPVVRKPASTNILTLGTLHYPPNADGIRWFMHEVFPLILNQVPEATLTIAGKNPPKDFLLFASQSNGSIKVTGFVPDLTPYLEEAALMVVPVRAGGGMRVRILEAFAQALPTVTTTIGLEGIDARPGEQVLVADTPSDFSAAAVRLLQDASLRSRLALNGRLLAERRYDWKVALNGLKMIYKEIEAKRVPTS